MGSQQGRWWLLQRPWSLRKLETRVCLPITGTVGEPRKQWTRTAIPGHHSWRKGYSLLGIFWWSAPKSHTVCLLSLYLSHMCKQGSKQASSLLLLSCSIIHVFSTILCKKLVTRPLKYKEKYSATYPWNLGAACYMVMFDAIMYLM